MDQNLDVIIAFVVIIAGLSMLLQMVTEALKNFFGLRWGVYETYLVSLYQRYFIEDIDKISDDKALWKKIKKELKKSQSKEQMGSISERFKDFNRKAVLLAELVTAIKNRLFQLQKETEEMSNDEFRALVKQKVLNAEIDEIKQAINRAQAINLGRLFSVYFKVHDNIVSAIRTQKTKSDELDSIANNLDNANKNILQFGAVLNNLNEFITELERTKQVTQTGEKITDKLRLKLAESVDVMSQYQTLVVGLANQLETNIDNWRSDLEKHYSTNITRWSFIIGFVLVAALNADSFTIYSALNNDTPLRDRLVTQSTALVKELSVTSRSNEINKLSQQTKALISAEQTVNKAQLEQFISEYKILDQALYDEATYLNEIQSRSETTALFIDKEKTLKPILALEKQLAETSIETKDISNNLRLAMAGIIHNYLWINTHFIQSQTEGLLASTVPLGWDKAQFNALFRADPLDTAINILLKLLSFALTAVLISFGSSFWNDLLKSLLGLKGFMKSARNPPQSS